MRNLLFIALLTSTPALADGLRFPSLVIGGTVYSNVTISRLEYYNAVCIHAGGIIKAHISTLPDDAQLATMKMFAPHLIPQAPRTTNEVPRTDTPPVPRIETKTDRFQKFTAYMTPTETLGESSLRGQLLFRAGIGVSERGTPCAAGVIDITHARTVPDSASSGPSSDTPWKYEQFHALVFLADNETIDLGEMTYKSKTDKDGTYLTCSEIMSAPIELSQLRRLAAATRVEFRVGRIENVMTPRMHAGIRTLVEHLDKNHPRVEEVRRDNSAP
jgi:hypothetical protein